TGADFLPYFLDSTPGGYALHCNRLYALFTSVLFCYELSMQQLKIFAYGNEFVMESQISYFRLCCICPGSLSNRLKKANLPFGLIFVELPDVTVEYPVIHERG